MKAGEETHDMLNLEEGDEEFSNQGTCMFLEICNGIYIHMHCILC